MVATSFELRPETRFDECTIKPARIGDLENFPAAIAERQPLERQWFKAGLHQCTYCTADLLDEMGDTQGANLFRDQSILGRIDSVGYGESCAEAGQILRRTGLISDGLVNPKIATRFVVGSDRNITAPKGRRASYRHLKGYGLTCRADTEHESVIRRLRTIFTTELQALYPGCDIASTLNLKAGDDLNQRPDIKFTVTGDTPLGPVNFAIAVEVQQSRIALENWRKRHDGLVTAANQVAWIFKRSRSGGAFKDILTTMVEAKDPAWVYSIDGEPGSEDGTLILTPAEAGYPDFWYNHKAPGLPDDNPVCRNTHHLQSKAQARQYQVKVSERSEVAFSGLGRLVAGLPGLTPEIRESALAKAGVKPDVTPAPQVITLEPPIIEADLPVTVAILEPDQPDYHQVEAPDQPRVVGWSHRRSYYSPWVGTRPWEHH